MMGLFSQQSEEEKFVRSHCLYVTTFFVGTTPSIYCKSGVGIDDGFVAYGRAETREEAWAQTKEKVEKRLAYLETLGECISEIDNSSIQHKDFVGHMLRKKFAKLGRGMKM